MGICQSFHNKATSHACIYTTLCIIRLWQRNFELDVHGYLGAFSLKFLFHNSQCSVDAFFLVFKELSKVSMNIMHAAPITQTQNLDKSNSDMFYNHLLLSSHPWPNMNDQFTTWKLHDYAINPRLILWFISFRFWEIMDWTWVSCFNPHCMGSVTEAAWRCLLHGPTYRWRDANAVALALRMTRKPKRHWDSIHGSPRASNPKPARWWEAEDPYERNLTQ